MSATRGSRPDGIRMGVDVGGTKCLGVALDATGAVASEGRLDTPRGGADLVATIVTLVRDLEEQVGPATAVGVGVPGLVDDDDALRVAPNLPGIADLPLGLLLRERLDVELAVDNDATCAMWGEYWQGAARGARTALLVTLGTGIGAGIVADGRLVRGANGFAGEAGHMVVNPDGPPCPCGRRGCWERYASGSGLGRMARDAAQAGRGGRLVELAGGDPEAVRGEHVTVAAQEGDADALAVLGELAWWLGLGIANLVNLLDSQVVVVGGGLVAAGDLLLEPTRSAFAGLVLGAAEREGVEILAAALGERAGAVGAALLAGDIGSSAQDHPV